VEAVNLICEKCPDVALREATDGFLPIHFAAQQGHLSTVKALVKAANTEAGAVKKLMARVVKGKRTLLHIALAKQHIEVGNYLVEKGIDAFALTDKEKLAVDFLDGDHKKKEFLDLLERHKANQERKREAPNVQYERKKLKTDGLAKNCEEEKADEERKLESKESEHAEVSIDEQAKYPSATVSIDEQAKCPSATVSIDEQAKAPPDEIAASIDEQAKAPSDEHTEAPP